MPLSVEGRPGTEASSWYKGRRLARDQLLGEHELCLRLGDPTRGDPSTALEVPIALTLLESPYDAFEVIEPFTAKILVASPGLARWRPAIGLAGGLLSLAVLLWYARERPTLPSDLGYAIGRASGPLVPGTPGPISLAARLLGLVGERPVTSPDGETVAWLRPVRDALYRLRPASGTNVTDVEERPLPDVRGMVEVDVHRNYHITSKHGRHVLRLAFSEGSNLREERET